MISQCISNKHVVYSCQMRVKDPVKGMVALEDWDFVGHKCCRSSGKQSCNGNRCVDMYVSVSTRQLLFLMAQTLLLFFFSLSHSCLPFPPDWTWNQRIHSSFCLNWYVWLDGPNPTFRSRFWSSRTWTQYTPSFQLISSTSSVLPWVLLVLFCFVVFTHLLFPPSLNFWRPPVASLLRLWVTPIFFSQFCSKLQRTVRTPSFISATKDIF